MLLNQLYGYHHWHLKWCLVNPCCPSVNPRTQHNTTNSSMRLGSEARFPTLKQALPCPAWASCWCLPHSHQIHTNSTTCIISYLASSMMHFLGHKRCTHHTKAQYEQQWFYPERAIHFCMNDINKWSILH